MPLRAAGYDENSARRSCILVFRIAACTRSREAVLPADGIKVDRVMQRCTAPGGHIDLFPLAAEIWMPKRLSYMATASLCETIKELPGVSLDTLYTFTDLPAGTVHVFMPNFSFFFRHTSAHR